MNDDVCLLYQVYCLGRWCRLYYGREASARDGSKTSIFGSAPLMLPDYGKLFRNKIIL